MENLLIGNWMETYSGVAFEPFNPKKDQINIEDIAHSLSMQCRFNGHTTEFYSVAQHSVIVSYLCDPEDALWGLLHDATEAYLSDLPKPVKILPQLKSYKKAEDELGKIVADRFDLEWPIPESVHRADIISLLTEKRDLMPDTPWGWGEDIKRMDDTIIPLGPKEAKELFLARYKELTA